MGLYVNYEVLGIVTGQEKTLSRKSKFHVDHCAPNCLLELPLTWQIHTDATVAYLFVAMSFDMQTVLVCTCINCMLIYVILIKRHGHLIIHVKYRLTVSQWSVHTS